jgi:hypothetical protein
MITPELMQNFLNFLTNAVEFDIRIVDDEDATNQLVDFFVDVSTEADIDEDTENNIMDWIFNFDRIIWCTVWLNRKEYNSIISKWYGRQHIKQDQFITNIITKDKKQMIITEFIKVKQKNSRKTIEEFQNELDELIKKEDYKAAAALKKKIDAKINPKPRKKVNKKSKNEQSK